MTVARGDGPPKKKLRFRDILSNRKLTTRIFGMEEDNELLSTEVTELRNKLADQRGEFDAKLEILQGDFEETRDAHAAEIKKVRLDASALAIAIQKVEEVNWKQWAIFRIMLTNAVLSPEDLVGILEIESEASYIAWAEKHTESLPTEVRKFLRDIFRVARHKDEVRAKDILEELERISEEEPATATEEEPE